MDTDRYDLSWSELEPDPEVGVDIHADACYDDDGKCECVCGLVEYED
jgi:hypothetical protein